VSRQTRRGCFMPTKYSHLMNILAELNPLGGIRRRVYALCNRGIAPEMRKSTHEATLMNRNS
jgi:hypothetical protein